MISVCRVFYTPGIRPLPAMILAPSLDFFFFLTKPSGSLSCLVIIVLLTPSVLITSCLRKLSQPHLFPYLINEYKGFPTLLEGGQHEA